MSVSANVYGHQAQPSSSTARRGETDFPDNSNFLITPAPRGLCEKSPNSVAELCVAPRRGGVGVGRSVFPTSSLGRPTPAPDWFVPRSSPKLPLLCPIGRGSRSKVVARPRPSASRYLRTFRERRGRRGRLVPPKTERGGSVPNEFVPNLPRSVFRLRRASPPYPLKSGQPRAQLTVRAGVASRLAYSRAFIGRCGDSEWTIRAGRENPTPAQG